MLATSMMQWAAVLVLLFMWCTQTVHAQGNVNFSLNGTFYQNNSLVTLDDIGEGDDVLLCLTNLTACCRPPYTNGRNRSALGNWFFPNGTRVPSSGLQWDFHRTRGQMRVALHRRRGGEEGVYRCVVPDAMNVTQTIYIGLYSVSTGTLEVISLDFNLTTELNSTIPTFTLTCTSTGGPVTMVTWMRGGEILAENSNYSVTSVVVGLGNQTYNHTLTVTGRLVGEYQCTVSNNKSSSSRNVTVVVASPPTNLTVELAGTNNISVSWTAPASEPAVIGFRIYHQAQGDQGAVDCDANSTECIISNCTIGQQYNITMVALSENLPSTLVGPKNIIIALLHNVTIVDSGAPTSGETYNLTCTVEANVPPTVQWLYSSNGTAVTNGSNIAVGTQRTTGSTTTLTLSFNPLHTSHGGLYTCQSTIGTPPSTVNAKRNMTVKVATPRVTITQDPTGTLYVGGNVTLECLIRLNNTVDTSVTVAVVWSASNGVAITNTSRYVVSPVTGSFRTYHAMLHLSNLMTNDSVDYNCSATASPDPPSPFIASSERQSELLSVTIVPTSSAPNIAAVSQSPTSINLTWTQPEGEVVDSYEVSFSYQGPCSGFNHTNTTTVDGTTRQYNLTGLQEFSNYTVTVVAENGAGRSGGSSVNVVTLANAPGDPPTDVTAMATSPVSILIRWGRVPCINRNSNITGYTVHYSRGGGSTESVSVSGTGQSERTYTATRLVPSTSYSIQVAAVTSTGATGPFSSTVTETTSPPRSVLILNGAITPNHGFVLLDNIGEGHASLLCLTDRPGCCRAPNAQGNWFFPNGTRVPSSAMHWDFHRTRGQMMVLLQRRRGGVNGIYCCEIPGAMNVNQFLYIGVYTNNTGDVVVSSIQFQLTSELNATTPTFTLTCISTGGPATTVSWTVNNSAVTEDSAHNITSQVLTDPETATYNHTLTVTGRLVGEYQCTVSNNKPSSSSGMLAVVAAVSPTNLTAEQLPQEPGSFRVSWTPPASSANLTGYHIYYSGADDSGSVDVGASATNITIDNRTAGVTYTIIMVALSLHLPSSVVGPVNVTLPVSPPTISITSNRTGVLYAGTPLTLTCSIQLNPAVDTTVMVTRMWRGPASQVVSNSSHVTVSNLVERSALLYETTIQFSPLNTTDSGNYECEATVTPDPQSQFIIMSTRGSDTHTVTVQALPIPNVQFTASTFAMTGQPYSLTCTVQVVQYLAASPDVTWLAPGGSSLGNVNGFTMRKAVKNGNITILRLRVDELAESHTGNYTCRACIFIDKAAIEGHCGYARAEVTLSVPGSVQMLETLHISDQSVNVLWREPVNTNGAVVNYTVQVQKYRLVSGASRELELVAVNPKFNQSIPTTSLRLSNDGRFMIIVSEGLEPLVPYHVAVAAVNLAGPGRKETKDFFTREGAPNIAPGNVEVIRLNGTAMNVSWVPLNLVEARGFVQSYIITYQQASTGSRRKRQVQTETVDGRASSAIVGGLQPGVAYEVTVSGMTTETGPVSSPTVVHPDTTSPPEGNGGVVAGVIVALVVIALVIILVVVIAYFLYSSRCKGEMSSKTKEMYLITEMYELSENDRPKESSFIRPRASSIRSKKDEAANEQQTDLDVDVLAPIPVPSVEVTDRMKPISIISFRDHVQQMHSEQDRGFESEYQSLGSEPTASHEVSKLPFNRMKNRFANIFPYDFSRVKLSKIQGEEGSDYINASFVDGYNRESAYIASQGPMPNTVSDFWRMIWENRLPNIVMLTKCIEAGRRKCEQYWGENIGDDFKTPDNKLRITTTYVLPLADFDIRNFTVKSIENPDTEPLKVIQYHFTSWPDHGVPKFATSLIAFIRRVQKGHNKDDGYPLLVHCSAGVGRTGTFILLDSMLERMKKEEAVNVYEFLFNMRAKRTMMVQSQAQYIFIHDALDELITCGETDISAAGLRVKVNRLRKTIPGKGITGFAEQFQLLDQVSRQPEEGDFSDAQEYYNRGKNRYPDKLPYNSCRTHLRPTGESGSEYINATFVDGYKRRNAYIATQAPLQTTVDDFWRMIWEFKSKAIVMLCNLVEDNQETSYSYWPTKEEQSEKYGNITVTMQSKTVYGDYSVRKFNLQEDTDQTFQAKSFQVTQFHYSEWPETGKPPSSGGLIEMIDLLMKTQMNTGNRAITVMCNDGVGRTGTFICIHCQLERLKTEGVVDIFQSIKSARIQRAGLVPEVDQYVFCHEVLADYVDEIANYANFNDMN